MVEATGRGGVHRFFVGVLLSVVLALGLVACGGDDDDGGAEAPAETQTVPVLIGSSESLNWSEMLVARDQGYFEEEGIEIEVQPTEGSGFVVQQVIAGEPFGWAGGDSILVAAGTDPDVRAVMCIQQRNIFQMVTLADSGVDSIEGLEGQALGITREGGGEAVTVDAALEEAGLSDSVETVPLGEVGPQTRNAIESGRVDAYASSYPDIVSLEEAGFDLVDITPERYQNLVAANCLMVTQSTIDDEELREQLVGLGRAWLKGLVFADENPDAAREIGCEVVPEVCEDIDFATSFVDRWHELVQPLDPSLPLGSINPESWEITYEILSEQEVIEGEVDVEDVIGGEELESLRDEIRDFDEDEVREEAQAAG